MHPLIDDKMIEAIRSTGNADTNLPDRKKILEEHALPYDRHADNVVISGCQILPFLPHIIAKFARLLDKQQVSYTFLSKEYCCGNYLYRPVIKAKDDMAMAACRDLSKEFIGKNIDQAKQLGAKRIIIFCSPCYPIYKHSFPDEDIVFYPAMINEIMDHPVFEETIDYYAGCYRLHKKLAPQPMDLASTNHIFKKIKGLKVNRISASKCCFQEEGLSHMIKNVQSDYLVHICTGCYGQALTGMPKDSPVNVLMLPEFMEMVMGKQK